MKLQSLGRPSHIKGFDELPRGLRDLIVESFSLHDRIVQLDRAFSVNADEADPNAFNPVGAQVIALQRAFSRAS